MLETQTAGWKRILTISLFVAAGLSAAAWALTAISEKIIDARQEALIEDLKTNFADSPEALVKQLCSAQTQFIIVTPPGMKRLHQSYGMMSFDPNAFPEEFLKGLVYDVESGCPVYTITVQEDPKTRDIHIYNGNDEPILTLVRDGYDPLWLVKLLRPETYEAKYTAAYRSRMEAWIDPARIEIELKLLPVDYIDLYAENSIASVIDALASLRSATPTGGMMMRSMLASSNIVFDAISKVSTGMCLVVSYPDNFTNRLEMFVSSNLLDFGWSLLATNLVTAGTNTLTWVDTSATNGTVSSRFYAAGNADLDSDGDGIVDGREILMYRTDPANKDSDGDGLVDGFSGIVTTNAYPGGIATNGNLYVEGELSWLTNPKVKDTDGDGMEDGWEVRNGHNPTDPNDPPNVSGTVFYSGRQTGTVWVIAVTSSNSWSTSHCSTSSPASSPNAFSYLIPDLEQTNYWVKAWLDSNLNGSTNATEARGILTNIAIIVTNRVTAQDFALADPDDDSDNLPDWWEMAYFGSTTNTGIADKDGDEYSNLDEYEANTDPTNNLSHPWNLSGAITYTGPQTGVIYVVACTNGTDWGWVKYDSLTNPGAFTITHLPPNTDYWVRAWRDSNGDGQPTSWEACGSHNSNPVFLDDNRTGQDITLTDPDDDEDGLPDWWEVRYGLDPTHGGEDGAAAWWKLDETSGTNVLDATANAYNGVLFNGGSNAWGTGVISNGLLLNGTNSYVEISDSIGLKPDYVSVGLWITPARLYTNGTALFLSKRVSGGTAGYSLGYENGALVFTFCSSGAKPLAYPCALTSGVPVHVAGTYNGTVQALYLNGVMVASTNYDWGMSGFGAVSQNTNVLRLGATSGTPTNFFAGQLDDVRVYSGELTTNQIHAIWELGADPDQDGLSNTEEYKHGTNPTNSDSDADGMLDGWEVKYGLNPLSPADATEDKDGDGYLNVYEAKRGSDPTSSNSIPIPTFVVANGDSIQAMINSVTQDYAVVQVNVGTFTGSGNRNLDFGGRNLMLVSESGPENTIIDCQQQGRGLIFTNNESRAAVIKGFTIRNAYRYAVSGNIWGGGILCSNASPTIFDSVFTNNSVYAYAYNSYAFGGALACLGNAAPLVSGCEMTGNGADYGGALALYSEGVTPIIRDSSIVDNGQYSISGQPNVTLFGGGIWAFGAPLVTNCLIMGNYAGFEGGGLYCGDTAFVTWCQIIDNTGEIWGGGGMVAANNVTVENCWIRNNTAIGQFGSAAAGGGIILDDDAIVRNCDISGNQVQWGDGGGVAMYGYYGGLARIEGSSITSNSIANTGYHGFGAGVGAFGSAQATSICAHVVQDCTLTGNYGADFGGGVAAVNSSLVLRRSMVENNTANQGGGVAVVTTMDGPETNRSPTLENCVLKQNESVFEGAGLYVEASTGVVSVLNCTFSKQMAGGTVFVTNSSAVVVRNSILWGNSGASIQATNSIVAVEYSCVQGGYAGTGNITNNPLLLPDGYHLLSASSPCWNTGSTNAPAVDIDGDIRPTDGGVDMGADELADTDGDGLPDYWESKYFGNPTNAVASSDPDGDGLTNLQEFQYGTDPTVADIGDSDGDGLVDAVERSLGTDPYNPDTDGDGMPDGWEVQYGLNPLINDALSDADGDGVNNLTEWYCGSNPTNTDSDADGLSDGDEISGAVMGSPTDPSNPDSDGDGIPDGQDLFPNSPQGDQDGDGISDSVDSDADNDGIVNSSETYSGNYPSINELGTFSLYPDSDGDGVPDGVDYDPDDPAAWQNPGSPDIVAPVITVISPLEGVAL